MNRNHRLSAIAAICTAGILLAGCGQKQSELNKDEQAQFGKYGQPMTPEVRAKYEAAMAVSRKGPAGAKAPN
jgi:hypothetical protein